MSKIVGYVEGMHTEGVHCTKLRLSTVQPDGTGTRFATLEITVPREEGHQFRIGQTVSITIEVEKK